MALLNVWILTMKIIERITTFIKRHQILTLFTLSFILLTILYVVIQNPPDDKFTTILSSDRKLKKSTTSKISVNTTDSADRSNAEYVSELIKSNPDRYRNNEVTSYTVLKKTGDYSVAAVEIYNNVENRSYTEYVIFQNSKLISGVLSSYQSSYLQSSGVPEEIIKAYAEKKGDV